ncbi:MAG: glycosyltransferase [Lachnospiraceae bacterium]|jgi:glycosyltransferase involved in cell wall biosynthesis|nr:glycosyltransferase [Lachnospiraceae bacterium]
MTIKEKDMERIEANNTTTKINAPLTETNRIEQDRISVIVPVHNGQEYLQACVESIVTQSEQAIVIEVIIINDGSTDKTAAVCERLQEEYNGVKVITMEDLGVSCARNAGLAMATGTYVTFVDADDRLLPGALIALLSLAKRTDSDITGCGFAPWQSEEEFDRLKGKGDQKATRVRENTYSGIEFIDKGILSGDTRCWSKLYRRQSIIDIRFEEGISIGEDMLFVLATASAVRRITISDRPGYAYFQNPHGAMNRTFRASYMDQITCWQMAAKRIDKLRPDLTYRATGILLISILLTVGKIAELPSVDRKQNQGRIKLCRQYLKEAIKVPGAFSVLDQGYKVKVSIFSRFPGIYVSAYHAWKGRNR